MVLFATVRYLPFFHVLLYMQQICTIFFLFSALGANNFELWPLINFLLPPEKIVVRLTQQSCPLLLYSSIFDSDGIGLVLKLSTIYA